MQKLLILQSLWAMEGRHHDGRELSVEAAVEKIVEAGYDGVSIAFVDRDRARRAASALSGTGLVIEGMGFPANIDGLSRDLEFATELGVHHLDIQPDLRPKTTAEAIAVLEGWERLGAQVPFEIFVETHRNRMTNDLYFTLELIERFPRLKLLADLSHYVVSREWWPPVGEENTRYVETIIDNAWAFHGRIATQEQIQVSPAFPQHRVWVDQFLEWWRYGFSSWKKRAESHGILSFVCELGPQPYAISDAHGRDLSDRWEDAFVLRDLVRKLWNELPA